MAARRMTAWASRGLAAAPATRRAAHTRSAGMAAHTQTAARLKTLNPEGTVFAEFTALANEHKAVNLGQGFPNIEAPKFIKDAAAAAVTGPFYLNQYTRSLGHPRLVQALATYYKNAYGRPLNPMTEVLTTAGATEAIYTTMQALVGEGDEVILMEPFYDSYPAAVTLAGATPVFVPLRQRTPIVSARAGALSSADWYLDLDELARAVTPRTRAIFVNTPLNPIGKIFTAEELQGIAKLAVERDLLVVSDEVYESLVYDDAVAGGHRKIAALPGMQDRTVTLGSAGKTFSLTGWKIGWIVGSAELIRAIWMVHQFNVFSVATPLQEAVAVAFEQAPAHDYQNSVVRDFQRRRDVLTNVLRETVLTPTVPDGSYFIVSDTSQLSLPASAQTDPRRDYNVCRWLTKEVGVTAIPVSAFYSPANAHLAGNLARFCFCKTDDLLDEAAKRLSAHAALTGRRG